MSAKSHPWSLKQTLARVIGGAAGEPQTFDTQLIQLTLESPEVKRPRRPATLLEESGRDGATALMEKEESQDVFNEMIFCYFSKQNREQAALTVICENIRDIF